MRKIERKERRRSQEAMEEDVKPGSLDGLCMHDRVFGDLFKGLDARELNWLLSDAPNNSVFIYDHASRSASRAGWNIPWPVLFFLGFRHKEAPVLRC